MTDSPSHRRPPSSGIGLGRRRRGAVLVRFEGVRRRRTTGRAAPRRAPQHAGGNGDSPAIFSASELFRERPRSHNRVIDGRGGVRRVHGSPRHRGGAPDHRHRLDRTIRGHRQRRGPVERGRAANDQAAETRTSEAIPGHAKRRNGSSSVMRRVQRQFVARSRAGRFPATPPARWPMRNLHRQQALGHGWDSIRYVPTHRRPKRAPCHDAKVMCKALEYRGTY